MLRDDLSTPENSLRRFQDPDKTNFMRKIVIVFGTRPEAIKVAPVIDRLRSCPARFRTVVCVTAQHREMLDGALGMFGLFPDYDLDIMKKAQDLFDVTANSLIGLRKVFQREKPDIVMVQGDTTTAFAAGLSAFYLKIPVAHIEAGLRTYNAHSPFPEETNRRLLSLMTDFHFAPTDWAKANLTREGVAGERVWVTGNTVIDALFETVKNQKNRQRKKRLAEYFRQAHGLTLPPETVAGFGPSAGGRKIILVTGHRRENFGSRFENIFLALREVAEKRRDVTIIYPVHLNPNVQRQVNAVLNGVANIRLIGPLDYDPFVFLMSRVHIVLTDSGGIQEEAPSLGRPVLVTRETTERPEGIEAGTVKLVGTDKDKIVREVLKLLEDPEYYNRISRAVNPYGDGKASERIVDALYSLFTGRFLKNQP